MGHDIGIEQFGEITKQLLTNHAPSHYLEELSNTKELQIFPYTLLWRLKQCEQSPKYHPEGSVWKHTMLVLDQAARVKAQSHDERAFMWAALLHDIGKPETSRNKKGRITSYEHDKKGEARSIEFLEYFTEDQDFIEHVASLVRFHMHILYLQKSLQFADTKHLLQRVDIDELALLCLCDRLGRADVDAAAEEAAYQEFLVQLKRLKAHILD